MSIKYRIVTRYIWILWNESGKINNHEMKNISRHFCVSITFIPNTELKSSMIMCRSSMCRRVFFTPFAEYNGGRFDGGEGINLSNCKLSKRLWHTSFTFDTDNCINFKVWYSVNRKKYASFYSINWNFHRILIRSRESIFKIEQKTLCEFLPRKSCRAHITALADLNASSSNYYL